MLKLVLWRNKSPFQIWGASIGVFIGLLLLLFAIQVYFDVQVLVQGARDSNVLVLNKIVKTTSERNFSKEDIEDFRKQPFFNAVEVFESNRYEVWADMKQLGFQTMLFFQSVPAKLLETDTSEFVWKGEEDPVPVIMSFDYLTLYNFGFGPSQGLPKVSADLLTTFEFEIGISGNNKRKKLKAYICGFTQNVNSILVPKSFMDYANREYGYMKEKNPSQVIVSTDNPYNNKLEQYLRDHELEISRGGLIGGELKSALYLLVVLVLVIGAIIIGLSLLVFILNFQLLIAQSSADIRLLLELGYKYHDITRTLSKRLVLIFIIIAFSVFGLLYPSKYYLTGGLLEQGYDKLSLWVNPMVVFIGAAFCLLFVWINYLVINRSVKKLA